MSVLNVVHGYSPDHKLGLADYFAKISFHAPPMTISLLRKAEHKAHSLGLQPFDDGYYRGWIHPCAVADMITDTSSAQITDVHVGSSDGSVRIGATRFFQTTTVCSTFLFGKNSDLQKFEYVAKDS